MPSAVNILVCKADASANLQGSTFGEMQTALKQRGGGTPKNGLLMRLCPEWVPFFVPKKHIYLIKKGGKHITVCVLKGF